MVVSDYYVCLAISIRFYQALLLYSGISQLANTSPESNRSVRTDRDMRAWL